MRYASAMAVTALVAALMLAGCREGAEQGESIGWTRIAGQTWGLFYARGPVVEFLILTEYDPDDFDEIALQSADQDDSAARGFWAQGGQKVLDYRLEFSEERSVATLNAQQYDLRAGTIFVLAEGFHIRQLPLEYAGGLDGLSSDLALVVLTRTFGRVDTPATQPQPPASPDPS